MTDRDLRFFLAHDINTPDGTIDEWRAELTEQLADSFDDTDITVTPGRDDYRARFKDAGGWRGWPKSVVNGTLWDGEPIFHGIIRPVDRLAGRIHICGRATYDMLKGFLDINKTVWMWSYEDGSLATVTEVEKLDGDDFKAFGRIHFEGER